MIKLLLVEKVKYCRDCSYSSKIPSINGFKGFKCGINTIEVTGQMQLSATCGLTEAEYSRMILVLNNIDPEKYMLVEIDIKHGFKSSEDFICCSPFCKYYKYMNKFENLYPKFGSLYCSLFDTEICFDYKRGSYMIVKQCKNMLENNKKYFAEGEEIKDG